MRLTVVAPTRGARMQWLGRPWARGSAGREWGGEGRKASVERHHGSGEDFPWCAGAGYAVGSEAGRGSLSDRRRAAPPRPAATPLSGFLGVSLFSTAQSHHRRQSAGAPLNAAGLLRADGRIGPAKRRVNL